MLNNLDTVISFAAIMLGVSLIVTVLTQAISSLLNLRGWQLAKGLAILFNESGETFEPALRSKLADSILKDPLIADGMLYVRRAPAIRKDELRAVLHRVVADKVFAPFKLRLDQLETASEQWFDSAMDRVSHRFAGWSRVITIVFSFAIAFALHLDAVDLFTRLSTDADLRASVRLSTDAVSKRAEGLLAPTPSSAGSEGAKPPAGQAAAIDSLATIQTLKKDLQHIQSDLDQSKVRLIPDRIFACDYNARTLLGVIASAVFLSLGAPFWFNMLKTLGSLRPLLANKVDEDAQGETPGNKGVA